MIKINMGCGWRNFGTDWIHIDGGDYEHLDHNDIINFPYENVDLIYASHVLSYFDRDEVVNVLNIWKNKLKYGGIIRLAVPNFESLCEVYFKENSIDKVLGPLYGKMKMDKDIIYHKTVYDKESLTNLLIDVGFNSVKEWDWKKVDHGKYDDHSQAYFPHMDKKNGIHISLNLEAVK